MTTLNKNVAEHLKLIGQLKVLNGDNQFSVKTYEDVSENILLLTEELTTASQLQTILDIPGVGSKTASVIYEFLVTGTSDALQELEKRWPVEILSMTVVDGIGPKRAYKLYQKGYHNFEQLHAAALAGELDAKLTTNVILASYKKSGRIPFHAANQIGNYFKEALGKVAGVSHVEVGGSIRRKADTAKDVDILACVETEEVRPILMEAFKFFGPGTFQGQNIKSSIQYPISGSQVIQVDLWIADKSYWGTLLNHVTGSKAHNIAIRTLALNKGMSVSEYGIFDNAGIKIGGEDEHNLYRIMDIPWVEPEHRSGELPEGSYNE